MKSVSIKSVLISFAVLIILVASAFGGALADRLFGIKPLDYILQRTGQSSGVQRSVVNEESVVIDVAEKVSPSVVTVSVQTQQRRVFEFSPFGGFNSRIEGGRPQDIGSGFIVSPDGLIVTNKHVVSETGVSYKVVTKDGKEYKVETISRDPNNDIAILKINAFGLKPIQLGDSTNLKVGQFVIAIGTALGEFRHTVTTGVISGLGRGIQAGNPLEGYVEQLDNVIQTDAAINPGNSGGPLLDSSGQVIGINVAVAQGAQNIGFAIPANVVKNALKEFKSGGGFPQKAYLGVQYQMISKVNAMRNNVPQGAYVADVVVDSPADKAGIKKDDIITKFDGNDVKDENGGLSGLIAKKKAGDKVQVEIWRDEQTIKTEVTLTSSPQ